MSSAFGRLRRALMQGAKDALAGMPNAVENAPFNKPANDAPWARTFIFMNQPTPATLGDDGEDAHDGFMQIDLNYKVMSGEDAVTAKADTIAAFFKAGVPLTNGGVTATVVSCGRSRGREVDGWYRVSMTVTWRARVPRNIV